MPELGTAIAAIPGSLVPQRSLSPVRVNDFIDQHPTLGPIYDTIGMFAVYTYIAPTVTDVAEAVEDSAPLVHDEMATNVTAPPASPELPQAAPRPPT